ncbi:sorting nexin-13 isoform X1 [Megalopta genalis]|uniref:sorting nexin-13 isoform X1 n=2 Tax=Megalopta genalis TaxID=115081 RepID=UPI0014435EE2|nr:sorting nexin-13-like isoform X1 [Megalopta genalis]XP_033337345.1 sorting nexin-13-like isoform X1 [Megalopta genalis]XP_033337346.1 sorting nexin-13-like isoform X2 [Megalopta genalis]XP_033337347.1 sorting nexin-13-like isoform X2 [Megalopta genalis]
MRSCLSENSKMNVPLYGLLGVATALLVYLIGIGIIAKLSICLLALILGIVTCVYRTYGPNLDEVIASEREDLNKKTEKFRQYILELSKDKLNLTLDKRITGSRIIDDSLQEILDFVIRDYVKPWYSVITDDEEFICSVRDTAQKIAINIANRVKGVDWIPYLTTRLVDDAASHVRLYRQARARMKHVRTRKLQKGSASSSTSGGTPKRTPTHRRNKSETDVSWYSQSKFYIPNLSSLTEPIETDEEKEDESLEKIFFDLEVQMEKNLICRDLVSTNTTQELEFLGEISEILLYLVLPKGDFDCLTVRFILRELLVNVIIRPLLDLFSDPDYINQACIWLCVKEAGLPSDVFLTVIRVTDSLDELTATKNIVCKEIAHLRSKDSGGEDNLSVKQQLNSLLYVKKLLETRIIGMQEGLEAESDGIGARPEWNRLLMPGQKLVNLPLDELLKNNIALSYFIDYMTSINAESYLYFYLNIYGWRVSAEQQISDIELQKLHAAQQAGSSFTGATRRKNIDLENLKEAATKIYQQYLSDKASPKLQLEDGLVKMLLHRIRTEFVKETWFDELRLCCYEKLRNEDRFLPGFKRSMAYVKLLAELDLLKDPTSEEDSKSLDSISLSSTNNELETLDEMSEMYKSEETKTDFSGGKSGSTTSLVSMAEANEARPLDEVDAEISGVRAPKSEDKDLFTFFIESNADQFVKLDENTYDRNAIKKLQQGRFEITARIIETGIVNDRGKTYGIYAVAVTKSYDSGYQEKWHIYRRYSDFHDLYQKIKEKYYDLAKIPFPAKKAFHNMERTVLERRMLMLNAWLHQLTKPAIVDGHMGLQNLLLNFLEQGDYDKGVTGGQISRTIDSLMNPLKTSMKTVTQAVKTMPDNMLNTVDGVMDNISKFFGNPKKPSGFYESTKVGSVLDTETDDNIPLRIMLLLMDEIFDLKVRNQWLRRRIVTLLRQIIRTMFGDIVNRRIVEYVSVLTSPAKVAGYLKLFKNSFWPNGVKAEKKPPRDSETKDRTRVAAKIALLSCLSDELKHIIGSETTRRGLLRVFELFQRPVLNRRLLYVLLEGIVETLFPENNLLDIFRKLYAVSPRVQNRVHTKKS